MKISMTRRTRHSITANAIAKAKRNPKNDRQMVENFAQLRQLVQSDSDADTFSDTYLRMTCVDTDNYVADFSALFYRLRQENSRNVSPFIFLSDALY